MESQPLMHRAPAPLLDIAYYDGVDAHLHKHKLDVFHPPNFKASAALRPVVLHVHGGGWVRGDRKLEFYGGPFMGRAFSERGYVTVVCSYRLSDHGKHPAQVRDVARALAWVMANIKSYGGDAGNVFLSGHSAGAHIISLLALHPKFLAEVGLTRSHIKGVVAISGIYHLLYPMHERSADEQADAGCLDWKTRLFHHVYVNPNFGTVSADLTDASPLVHLRSAVASSDVPPFLVINAASDLGLEIGGNWFAREMQRNKAEASYHVVPGTNHATVTRSDATVQLAHAFFQHRLQLQQTLPKQQMAQASVAEQPQSIQST